MRNPRISISSAYDRVTIYNVTEGVKDVYGNPAITYSVGVTLYASVMLKSGGTDEAGNSLEYSDVYNITLRIPVTINKGDRVDFEGVKLLVTQINKSDKTWMKIQCQAI